jgi:hypothetical protein
VLESEIQALEAAGMHPEKDERSFAKGIAAIHIQLKVRGSTRIGRILYPGLYPYFRPILLIPELGEGLRHYNPISGEVCLLRRGTEYWQPSMTAAKHILDMLEEWESAADLKYEEPRLASEDSQAEPITAYYPTISTQLIIMDSSWQLPVGRQSGIIQLAFPNGHFNIDPLKLFTAWACEILDSNKKSINGLHLTEKIKTWIKTQEYETRHYPWIKLDSLPSCGTTDDFTTALLSSDPIVMKHISKDIQNCRSGIYGFCIPEEAPYGGTRDGWVFLAYHFDHKAKRKGENPKFWAIKTNNAGEKDLFERVPEMKPLRNKTVAVVGLGCVGAPSALAFARAGINELRLLDGDYVSPGTTCRWPLGLSSAGGGKVQELTQFIEKNYPLTKIGTNHYPFGTKEDCRVTIGAYETSYDQWECLEKLTEGADLIYDATAEPGINQLLCEIAARQKIPYITVSARAGGWGGHVVRVKPDSSGGCYLCYLHSLYDGEIPQAPFDPKGDELQPAGCGDITFKAAGFDVEEIALGGVRMAVSTLCEREEGGYPPMSHDVGIVSLRDMQNGETIFPQWHTALLRKHPKCGACNK